MDRTVEEIEDLRLRELRKQAAIFGPQTDPAILIEIQELSHKQVTTRAFRRPSAWADLDYDFLMNVVAAALVRLGAVEANLTKNDRRRALRQLIHDLWMVAITTMVFLILWMQVVHK